MSTIKNPVGRPSKYNPDLQALADRYIFDYHEQEDVIPSAAGLCVWLGISRSTLHEWERIHLEFSNTLDAIRSLQEKIALNKGITGEFNSTITKLVLANHGYSEKQDLNHVSEDRSMTPQAAGDAVLAALARKHSDTRSDS